MNKNTILITGAAGFIGYHLTKKLISKGFNVIGFDNLNSYYDINLKISRLDDLNTTSGPEKDSFTFIKGDLESLDLLNQVFDKHNPTIVVNLAAQAGVRYSLKNPQSYINSNLVGFSNLLESCRKFKIKNLIFASSSSVYGGNTKTPFSEKDNVDHPLSLYAATKKANELMAHTYSHLYDLPCIGLRFFTVYGPWGRPDMAPMLFTKSILENKPIKIFNNGRMARDFTYIDDVVEVILKLIWKPATPNKNFKKENPDPSTSWNKYKIFNIGNSNVVPLMDFINILEQEIGIKAEKIYCDMQAGDVKITSADTSSINQWIEFKPNTPIRKGIRSFINWYRKFYNY
tara:strand:- start:9328 stop:10359 length:1032 start_codon:yes stop_codon:yes gene_type:complete